MRSNYASLISALQWSVGCDCNATFPDNISWDLGFVFFFSFFFFSIHWGPLGGSPRLTLTSTSYYTQCIRFECLRRGGICGWCMSCSCWVQRCHYSCPNAGCWLHEPSYRPSRTGWTSMNCAGSAFATLPITVKCIHQRHLQCWFTYLLWLSETHY